MIEKDVKPLAVASSLPLVLLIFAVLGSIVGGIAAPPSVTSRDIYVGVMPFVALQVAALVMLFFFPGIATWLPRAIGW